MPRCEQCKKKLGLMEYKCKCEKIFCITHLHYEEHNCTYNYKEEGIALLKKQIEIGNLSVKLDKI
jgi:hypothetical protein